MSSEDKNEETEDANDLLKILELLKRKSNENEKELDAHKRMLSMMLSGQGKLNYLGKENEEKQGLSNRAQRKR